MNASKPRLLVESVLFSRSANQRMHNKVMIFDDQIAITGGRNIDNHYYNRSTSYNFIDRDALVIGPVVPLMRKSFDDYWRCKHSCAAERLGDVAAAIQDGAPARDAMADDFMQEPFFSTLDRDANDVGRIQERFVNHLMPAEKVVFFADEPGKNKQMGFWGGGEFTRLLRKTLRETEKELVIQSPYLVLNWQARRVFKKIRKHHPDIPIIVSTNSYCSTDNILAYSANFKLRGLYIKSLDFYIYEYKARPDNLSDLLPNYTELEKLAQKDGEKRSPFLSMHAKSFVRDDRLAYIGSYNLDPRSDNLNTEVGLLIEDRRIAAQLKADILRATQPGCSWVIAKQRLPLEDVNYLIEGISGLSPVDIWPLRNTSSFDLKPGKEPLPPDHKDFYEHYTDAGSFPGAEGLTPKEIVTNLYKVFNTLALSVL